MFLLDTCALIWFTLDRNQIPKRTRALLVAGDTPLAVSAITGFEIAMLVRKGRLRLPQATTEWLTRVLEEYVIDSLPLSLSVMVAAAELPAIHADPCDRMIIATAKAQHLTLVTADRVMPTYPGVKVVW